MQEASKRASANPVVVRVGRRASPVWVEGDKQKDGGGFIELILLQTPCRAAHRRYFKKCVPTCSKGVAAHMPPASARTHRWCRGRDQDAHVVPGAGPRRTRGAGGGAGLGLDQLSLPAKIAS